ncbi:hypothetical protein [Rhizobium rhizosphaerae]|uniref:hypothetical protein n=1 Tax=Xaviernesmea rhizosphaerae TaxID=1672749 RepID=UPI00111A1D5D|nr:hypothetical protein [Xaviernesmea rhizosphaerae]
MLEGLGPGSDVSEHLKPPFGSMLSSDQRHQLFDKIHQQATLRSIELENQDGFLVHINKNESIEPAQIIGPTLSNQCG